MEAGVKPTLVFNTDLAKDDPFGKDHLWEIRGRRAKWSRVFLVLGSGVLVGTALWIAYSLSRNIVIP